MGIWITMNIFVHYTGYKRGVVTSFMEKSPTEAISVSLIV